HRRPAPPRRSADRVGREARSTDSENRPARPTERREAARAISGSSGCWRRSGCPHPSPPPQCGGGSGSAPPPTGGRVSRNAPSSTGAGAGGNAPPPVGKGGSGTAPPPACGGRLGGGPRPARSRRLRAPGAVEGDRAVGFAAQELANQRILAGL